MSLRFHICCAHELCEMDVSNFDPKINNENLEKTMKTVLDMYEDVHLHHAGKINSILVKNHFGQYEHSLFKTLF